MLSEADLQMIMDVCGAATPAPVSTIILPPTADPIAWFRESLEYSPQVEVFGVATGTPEDIAGGVESACTAYTGNGPTSHANADFYAMCHCAIPALVEEIRRLRRDLREHLPRRYHPRSGIAKMPLPPCDHSGAIFTGQQQCEVCSRTVCEACSAGVLLDPHAFPCLDALCAGMLLCCHSCAQVAHGYLCRLEEVLSNWREASKEVSNALES